MSRPLAVLVDARALAHSGIGRYLREVAARLLADARFGAVAMLGRPEEVRAFAAGRPGGEKARAVAFPHWFYSAAAQAHWTWLAARGELRADLAFFPHYDVPLPPVPAPFVVAVQDLSHWRLPELFPAWKRALGKVVLDRAVARAARVLVSSRATERDLLAAHPRAAGKVARVPLGVGGEFVLTEREAEAARERARAAGPYLLCVGNRKPHKNMAAAVEVLARLRPDFPALRLVIVGRDSGEDAEVFARARALGVADALVARADADDAALRDLYAGAECLLFPSLYEGFGLPPLEAMGCGAPVVASDRASIPEVVGDAAVLRDPRDHAGMAEAVRRLMTEPAFRTSLVERGRERARELSWDATAAATLDVLCEAGGRVPRPGERPVAAAR